MRAQLEALAERVTEHVVELNEGLSERGERGMSDSAVPCVYCVSSLQAQSSRHSAGVWFTGVYMRA